MVTNLNKRLDLETMNEHLDLVFKKIFPGTRVVSAKVVGHYDELFKMALKLKEHKKYHKYYAKHNLKALNRGDKSRKFFYKKLKGCCKGIAKYDAEDYFMKKIEKHCLKIRLAEEEKK